MRSVVSCPTSLSALGRLKNQTTSFFGLQPLVAHADVGDGPIYVPAYRSGERPFDVKLDPGARRRMRTVSRFLDPAAIASRWRGRILAETLRLRSNKQDCGIRFVFLVIANTWAIGRRVSYYRAGFS